MIKIIKNLLNQNVLIDNAPCIEWCSTCGEEVEIEATFCKVQKCPECGEHILPCNLCDTDKTDCFKCQNIYSKMIAGEYKRQQVPAENIIMLEGYYYKFNEKVILRTDSKTQAEIMSKYVNNGIYTPNEARGHLDMHKIDGADKLIVNGNYIPIDIVGKQYLKGGE